MLYLKIHGIIGVLESPRGRMTGAQVLTQPSYSRSPLYQPCLEIILWLGEG
jgi:hypothetical protein